MKIEDGAYLQLLLKYFQETERDYFDVYNFNTQF